MKRRLLNLATVISTVLCLLIVACWVRSYHVRDILHFGVDGGNAHTVQSILGRVHLVSDLNGGRVGGNTSHTSDRLSPNAIWNGAMSGYPVKVEWHLGLVFQRYSNYHMPYREGDAGFTTLSQLFVVPYWWMAMLIGILPALRLAQVAGQCRRNSGTSTTDMHNNALDPIDESAPSVAPSKGQS